MPKIIIMYATAVYAESESKKEKHLTPFSVGYCAVLIDKFNKGKIKNFNGIIETSYSILNEDSV